MIIEGPSGLRCEARKFRGVEIQALADQLEEGESMGNRTMTQLLTSCWQSTLDPGPYLLDAGVPNFYNKVLKNDLVGLLLTFRCGSFRDGSDYEFLLRCEDRMCARFRWAINIAEHVLPRTRKLSEEGCQHLTTGEPIEVDFEGEDGATRVGFQLLTLAREAPFAKFVKQEVTRRKRVTRQQLLSDRIAAQIVMIDGQRVSDVRKRWEWAVNRTAQELYDLRDLFDSHECEVDTELTVKCSTCRLEFDVDLPFGRSFLDPSSLSRREKRFGNDDASFDDRQGHQASAVTIQTSALPSSGELIGKLKRVLQPKPPMTGAG